MAKNEINLNVNITGVEDIRKLIEELQANLAEEPAVEPLKVGDFVKAVKADNFSVGDLLEITGEDNVHFIATRLRDGYWHYADKEGELILATDEEAAEVKAEQERKLEAEKWAKIGRKPNELKEGDLVKYRNKSFAEVTRAGIYDISVKMPNGSIIPVIFESVTLIAPAEARFDA